MRKKEYTYEQGRKDAVNEVISMMTRTFKNDYIFRDTLICEKMEKIRDKQVIKK